jgi:UDP-GlcNAc3NAcA epimerase
VAKVGDVMYDAALYYGTLSSQRSDILNKLQVSPHNFILCTIHRQENTDNLENLKSIITTLNRIHRDKTVVLPMHPRTRKILAKNKIHPEFTPVDPVGYYDIIELLKHCCLVITDSGGMQKEAYFFNKYCITIRTETEWTELVDHHYNYIAGTDGETILRYYDLLRSKEFKNVHQFYGSGDASQKIVSLIS